MIKTVVKRDGRVVDFDVNKIKTAIRKAMLTTDLGENEKLIDVISSHIAVTGQETMTVEQIQDMAEIELMSSERKDVAKRYIAYRDQRSIARRAKTADIFREISEAKSNEITRENANMNADSPAGMMMKFASESTKPFVDDYLLSKEAREAFKDGYIHIHDKDYYPTKSLTCVQHPLDKILNGGFIAGHGEARPTKRIETASTIACISLETAQNEMHGGQAIPAFDFYLAPFVRKSFIEEVKMVEALNALDLSHLYNAPLKDFCRASIDGLSGDERWLQHAVNRTVARVHQSMEAFIHNMNTIHCVKGDEFIWVIDHYDGRIKQLTIRELCDTYFYGRYDALSVNSSNRVEWKPIYGAKYSGQKDVYRVKGKAGHEVYVTENHRIGTSTRKGEIIYRYPLECKNLIIPSQKIKPLYDLSYKWDLTKFHSRKRQNYSLPYIPMSVELCELLGLWVADGSITGGSQLAFSVCDEELTKRALHLMQTVYGPDVSYSFVTYSKPKKIHAIRFNVGKVWALNVADVCGRLAKNKQVPYFVLGGTKEMQRAFLRGYLLCDGSIKTGEGFYDASSVSQRLINGIDFIYQQLGEFPYRRMRKLTGYHDKSKIGSTSYEISLSGKSDERLKLGFHLESQMEYRKHNKDLSTPDYFVEDVVAVALDTANCDVYDIAVKDNENFITANGVLIHNSRGGNQVVFSSINYGTDTSAEGRCIIRELLNSTYEGVGNGSTAIFPIQIWKKKCGVNYCPGDPNYDLFQLACKVTARRFFPNFVNLDADFNKHELWREDDPLRYRYEVATMGCRTRVFENRYGDKTSIGRGNLSFSTINIVRLAIECMNIQDKDERIKTFFNKLDSVLEIVARQLCNRFDFQKTALAKQFPLLISYLWTGGDSLDQNDTIEPVLNQGTLGIGFIGLAECLVALTGKHHAEDPDSQALGIRIVRHMRSRANEFSERYEHNFSVLATPAEGLAGKFTAKDRKSFGSLPGITDRDYYTNSNHVPVYFRCSPRHKAEIEAPYHELTRGGHIFYVEIDGDASHNPQAIASIVDLMDRYNIGYCSVNHNRNRCMKCGYEDATKDLKKCPTCGSTEIDTLQRITGYLVGTTSRWNHGKLAELKDRVVHK